MGETIRSNNMPDRLERMQLKKKKKTRLRGREKEKSRVKSLNVI